MSIQLPEEPASTQTRILNGHVFEMAKIRWGTLRRTIAVLIKEIGGVNASAPLFLKECPCNNVTSSNKKDAP